MKDWKEVVVRGDDARDEVVNKRKVRVEMTDVVNVAIVDLLFVDDL